MAKREQLRPSEVYTYRHKAVRDLRWVLESPNLCSSREASLPLLCEKRSRAIVAEAEPWLRGLDEEPDELVSWLAEQHNVRRLGFYFAALLEFWARFCPAIQPDPPYAVLGFEENVDWELVFRIENSFCN